MEPENQTNQIPEDQNIQEENSMHLEDAKNLENQGVIKETSSELKSEKEITTEEIVEKEEEQVKSSSGQGKDDEPENDESAEIKDNEELSTEEAVEKEKEQVKSSTEQEKIDESENKEDSSEEVEVSEQKSEEETPIIEKNYNDFTKEQLVEELEDIVNNEDFKTIKSKIAFIKVAFLKNNKEERKNKIEKFIAEGGKEEDYKPEEEPLNERFNAAFNIYKQKKAEYNRELEKQKIENLEARKQILEELKELINSEETLKQTYDDFKNLQEKWKQIGMVPKSELNNLWQNYHFLVEKFFDRVKINKELKDLDLKKNLEAKILLCEKTEELLLENSLIKSFKALQKYHQEWKEIGPVARDKKDEIWERFKTATEKINKRRREYYVKLQDEQQKNYTKKLALCDKAEEILSDEATSIKKWQENTEKINNLFSIWKTVGRAPKKTNDEVWTRFKTILDTFFLNKKEFFNSIKDKQINNYNLKIDLCAQAEAIKTSTDWKKTKNDLINLQKEWKKIGPVPRKYSDKLWKRFRAACDEFFNNMNNYYKNIHSHEIENLNAKKELIKKIKDFKFSDDKNKNLDILKEFQRNWIEIGFVPIAEKEKLQLEFRQVINSKLDELNISHAEIDDLKFKSKYDSIKESPNANKLLYKEKVYISNKIKKITDDINLWENNIGFLANSKNAEILKSEFEKKINKAKKEVEVLNKKIKYLNSINN